MKNIVKEVREFRDKWISEEVKHTKKMCRTYESFTRLNKPVPPNIRVAYMRYIKAKAGYFPSVSPSKGGIHYERVSMPLYADSRYLKRTAAQKRLDIARMANERERGRLWNRCQHVRDVDIPVEQSLGAEIILQIISKGVNNTDLTIKVRKHLNDL